MRFDLIEFNICSQSMAYMSSKFLILFEGKKNWSREMESGDGGADLQRGIESLKSPTK